MRSIHFIFSWRSCSLLIRFLMVSFRPFAVFLTYPEYCKESASVWLSILLSPAVSLTPLETSSPSVRSTAALSFCWVVNRCRCLFITAMLSNANELSEKRLLFSLSEGVNLASWRLLKFVDKVAPSLRLVSVTVIAFNGMPIKSSSQSFVFLVLIGVRSVMPSLLRKEALNLAANGILFCLARLSLYIESIIYSNLRSLSF